VSELLEKKRVAAQEHGVTVSYGLSYLFQRMGIIMEGPLAQIFH
jgi:hypothetical protein